jgi:hypothetical protein
VHQTRNRGFSVTGKCMLARFANSRKNQQKSGEANSASSMSSYHRWAGLMEMSFFLSRRR